MKLKMQLTPPERLEKEMLRRWPTLDGYMVHMRGLRSSWPEWCYLPMSVSLALVTHGADKHFAELYLEQIGVDIIYKLSAIIPWRLDKRIYMFDRTFSRQIQRPALSVPEIISALIKLPSPGVYISDPPGIDKCQGVFCFLESQQDMQEVMELRLHYLFEDESIIALHAVLSPQRPLVIRASDDKDKSRAQSYKDVALAHINMLMYLCGDNPDIVRVDKPRTIERSGLKLAVRPDVYKVGFETGAMLRKKAAKELSRAL